MKPKPINLKTHEVQAILAGEKVQHRVAINPTAALQEHYLNHLFITQRGKHFLCTWEDIEGTQLSQMIPCLFGEVGTLLWVREKWSVNEGINGKYVYGADHEACTAFFSKAGDVLLEGTHRWQSLMHMPKEASRLTLEVTNISVERAQDTTEDAAKMSGYSYVSEDGEFFTNCRDTYLYENDREGSNPWTWIINFKTHKKNVEEAVNGNV